MSKYIPTQEFWDNIYEDFSPSTKRNNGSLTINKEFGKLQMNYFSTGIGINYSSCKASFNEDTVLEGLFRKDMSFLLFIVGNDTQMIIDNKNIVNFNESTFYSGKQFNGNRIKGLYNKNKEYIFHYLYFEDELFKSLEEINSNKMPITQSNYFSLNYDTQISVKQKILLEELLKIKQIDSKLEELFLESKILDLAYDSLSTIKDEENKSDIILSVEDKMALKKAKEILINNIHNPPSLKELAHKSAINEFKLKKGFKQLFGNTVYGLLQEYRLNKAKKLLEIDDINISEAAYLVGYKNISHFSTIFKKYFGYSPINIKKKQKKYYL